MDFELLGGQNGTPNREKRAVSARPLSIAAFSGKRMSFPIRGVVRNKPDSGKEATQPWEMYSLTRVSTFDERLPDVHGEQVQPFVRDTDLTTMAVLTTPN
jgi:hypothetical protein